MLNIFMCYHLLQFLSCWYSSCCKHVFLIRVDNCLDPDQINLSEASKSGSKKFQNRINAGSAGHLGYLKNLSPSMPDVIRSYLIGIYTVFH